MSGWLQAQLKAAEGLLEGFDKTVSSSLGLQQDGEGDGVGGQPTPGQQFNYGAAPTGAPGVHGASWNQEAPGGAFGAGTPGANLATSKASGYTQLAAGYGATQALASSSHTQHSTNAWRSNVGLGNDARPSAAFGSGGAAAAATAAGFVVQGQGPIPFGGPSVSSARGGSSSVMMMASSEAPSSTTPGVSPSFLRDTAPSSAVATASNAAVPYGTASPGGVAGHRLAAATTTGTAVASAPGAAPSLPAGAPNSGSTFQGKPGRASSLSLEGGPAANASAAQAPPAAPSATPGGVGTKQQADAPPAATASAAAAAHPGQEQEQEQGSAPTAQAQAQDTTRAAPSASGAPAAPTLPPAAPPPPVADRPAPAATSPSPAAAAAAATPAAFAAPQVPSTQPVAASATPAAGAQPAAAAVAGAAAPAAAVAAATSLASLASATSAAVSQSLLNLMVVDDGEEAARGGASADAQLARTCEQLRKRLEASRLENEQLEDMLARAEVRAQQEAATVAALRSELAGTQQSRSSTESSLAAQLAAARAQLSDVSERYEAAQRSALVMEGQLEALQESSRRLAEQHSDMEGGMVEALKSELSAAESRLESERKAHAASRAAAASRERDLEQQVAGSTAALTDLQRSLEEGNRKHRDLEDQALEATRARNDLAAQLAALQQQLADGGVPGLGHAAGGSPLGGHHARAAAQAELEALHTEAAQLRRAVTAAEQARHAAEAQLATAMAELQELRQALSLRKDTAQLEAQVREMSDILYLKQTQLERLAAEKAAQQLKTERELDAAKQELNRLRQGGGAGGGADSLFAGGQRHGGDGRGGQHDIIPMDALGEPYQRLARHNKVGKAVKAAANFLDTTASTASFFLRQYPLGRLIIFAYIILIHLYVYVLIARMQRIATHMENAASVAPSLGT